MTILRERAFAAFRRHIGNRAVVAREEAEFRPPTNREKAKALFEKVDRAIASLRGKAS